jgi:hypothetical protein
VSRAERPAAVGEAERVLKLPAHRENGRTVAAQVDQERGVAAGAADRQLPAVDHPSRAGCEGFAVDLDAAVAQQSHKVVGGALEGEQVAAVLPALQVGSATAMNASSGQLPAPAPVRRRG